ncbi:MAG TPA: hypothetical protein VFJ47_11200 [Terriglobales bacterium]|nr:hypothetical protein [Terriglobales bacterium]
MHSHIGHKDTNQAANQGQEDTFCEQLAQDSYASSAQRHAQHEFSAASRGAHEQKIGDVRAHHQQNQADGPEKKPKLQFDISHEFFSQGKHIDTDTLVRVGMLARHALGDAIHLCLSLAECHSGFHPRQAPLQVVAFMVRQISRIQSNGHPKLVRLRSMKVGGIGKAKAAIHYADHLVADAVKKN